MRPRFKSDEKTDALIKGIQESGVYWLGGAKWHNRLAVRISVSSYKTTYEDIDISATEILRITQGLKV